jgi:hypothetical protein
MKFINLLTFLFCFTIVCEQSSAQQYQLSKKDTNEVRFVNSRKFWIYKVEKGETLFSISQKFKIPQEEIHEFNKEISESGLKAKMKIWIPAYSWINKNKIPEKVKEEPEPDMKQGITRMKVLVLSSLGLHKVYLGGSDLDSTYVREALPYPTKENLEFVEGVIIASRELSNTNRKLNLIVRDTQGDSSNVAAIFSRLDLSTLDLIITNENGPVLRQINKYSMLNSIPLFSAGINTTDIIRRNSYAYALSPSSLVQCRLMGSASSSYFKNANCVVLKTGQSREDERSDAFKDGWMELYKPGTVKKVNFSNGYSKAVKDSMQKNKTNIIFVPSSNEDIISSLLSSLKLIAAEYKISVIGLPTWLYSQSIDPQLFDTCDTHLFSAGYIDFENRDVVEFRKKFRDHYHSEPIESAYLGHDALQIGLEKYLPDNRKKPKDKWKTTYDGIYSTYQFMEVGDGLCKENNVIQLYRFEKAVPVHFVPDDKRN